MIRVVLLVLTVSILQAKMIDALAAIVEDAPITLYDINKLLEQGVATKQEAIDLLIRKKLEEQEIKKRGITVGDEEVYDEIERLARANGMTITQFYDAIQATQGLNSNTLKERIKEQILAQRLYQDIVAAKMQRPDESEIEEYFLLHKDSFAHPSYYDVVIYTSLDAQSLSQKIQNPMLYLQGVHQQKQHIPYKKLPPQLAKLLDSTKEGSFTQIVPSGNGYMSIYIQKRGESEPLDLQSLRPRIVDALMRKKQEAILKDYFTKLRDSADVVILRKEG